MNNLREEVKQANQVAVLSSFQDAVAGRVMCDVYDVRDSANMKEPNEKVCFYFLVFVIYFYICFFKKIDCFEKRRCLLGFVSQSGLVDCVAA